MPPRPPKPPRAAQDAFLRELIVRWERVEDRAAFPFALPAIRGLERLRFDPAVTILAGENGSGKSTLIEAIAEAAGMNAEGGSRNARFHTTGHEGALAKVLTLVRGTRRPQTDFFLRAESFFNVISYHERLQAGSPLPEPDLLGDLHCCSHGEGFLHLVLKRFGPRGLYVLDEPESALSPQNLLTLMARMNQLIAQGSQFILATHSPILMSYPGAALYWISTEGIALSRPEETPHFHITRRFLGDPSGVLRELFSDEDDFGS